MSEDPASVLQHWASQGSLGKASLNDQGTELSFNGITLSGTETLSINHADKTCVYSLASIFLQILDPEQSLVQYRKACKQYHVSDPIKATDKPTILGFFFQDSSEEAAVAPAAPPEEGPAATVDDGDKPAVDVGPAPPVADRTSREKDKHLRDDRRKDKDRHRSSSKDKHRHDKKRSHSTSRSEEKKKKKAPKTFSAETLFSNLVTVVGKRSKGSSQQKREETALLMAALSTEGFEVTPDVLSKFKEKSDAIVANEIPVGNSASILKAAAGKDMSRILKMYLEVVQPKSSKSSSSNKPSGDQKIWRTHLLGKKPIIIVPKGMTCPITLLNSHEFFCNASYVPREVMMKKGFHNTNVPTSFSRRVGQRLGGGVVEYEILDNPKAKLPTAKDWDRVVAVVCLGQSWQFKDWPGHYSDPVRLFGSVYGFYCGMEGAKIPDEVNAWAVTKAKLNRDKRGLDSVTYASFWNGVDEYMAIHKREMLPQQEG
jgi:parafibromin